MVKKEKFEKVVEWKNAEQLWGLLLLFSGLTFAWVLGYYTAFYNIATFTISLLCAVGGLMLIVFTSENVHRKVFWVKK